jgi:hypothetical protein
MLQEQRARLGDDLRVGSIIARPTAPPRVKPYDAARM